MSRRSSIFLEQRQPFLQFSPIIEMFYPIYHGSLKAFISPVDGTRITRRDDKRKAINTINMGVEATMISKFNQEERHMCKNAWCLKRGFSLPR